MSFVSKLHTFPFVVKVYFSSICLYVVNKFRFDAGLVINRWYTLTVTCTLSSCDKVVSDCRFANFRAKCSFNTSSSKVKS